MSIGTYSPHTCHSFHLLYYNLYKYVYRWYTGYIVSTYITLSTCTSLLGTPSTPILTSKSTHNEILVLWSPVGSDGVCGPVTYNVTVMPSHGMMMMINDTVYSITGLNYNTNYIITVYATNRISEGELATVTVTIEDPPPGT